MYTLYLLWGGAIGIFSGFFGIGGGIFIIPSLTFFFGLSQHQAQGTSLAMMVPPIGLLAAYRYWKSGNVVLPIAFIGALGFVIGGYLGAELAHHLSDETMRKFFGLFLIGIGVKILIL